VSPKNNKNKKLTDVSVQGKTAEIPSPCESLLEESLPPFALVIFGASGDLAARKLIPALYKLFMSNGLSSAFIIVGCGRTKLSDEKFRSELHEAGKKEKLDLSKWNEFAKQLFYQQLEYNKLDDYKALAENLKKLDKKHKTGGNRIFYLAIPPSLAPDISTMLGKAGLSKENASTKGWARIVVEKPFGRDLESAVELDDVLHRSFDEKQIFRIDHYLAKETVQNILMLRFANTIFEPLWNRSFVDYVGIITAEKIGVERRAGYYEQTGVLRDMFQNHMMQLLALTALEPPPRFEADQVQDEKVKVFKSLKPFDLQNPAENLILGQYVSGLIDDQPVGGYREEPEVNPVSLTPTFAMMRVFIDNWRWRGVPFYLVSGKRLAQKQTAIVIQFKQVPHSMFKNILEERIIANRLILEVYPEEKTILTFQAKNPGTKDCLRSVTMDFNYYQGLSGPKLDAYEKVLLDCIRGDHMLFWRQDGIKLSWSFLTPILERCESCSERKEQLQFYEAGSWGPRAAQEWMKLILTA